MTRHHRLLLTRKETAIAANSSPTVEQRVNERIRAREVRLIGSDGTQLGIKALPEALALARELDLDLVEVSPGANPPVCKIMDYGKARFEAEQKAREGRRKSRQRDLKEMRFGIRIGPGDFATKVRKIEAFLAEGHKVKVILRFRRGREMGRTELGRAVLARLQEQLADAKVESPPRMDGGQIVMIFAPGVPARSAQSTTETASAGP